MIIFLWMRTPISLRGSNAEFRRNIAMMRMPVIPLVLLFVAVFPSTAGEDLAMERLMEIVTGLQEIGDEMVAEPVSGELIVGDTVSHDFIFDQDYMYFMHIWTDSYFNEVDFWLEDLSGSVRKIQMGYNAIITLLPDTSETLMLKMLLWEGAESDTAYYAAALLRSPRYLD
jgi:hypothetical protein